jgi:addiction module HigA family antidote
MTNRMRPIHPGEILRDEYLLPLDMSANRLADALGVPTNRITSIINGERAVTADTALRLGKFFQTSPDFWMNLQQRYDLRVAEEARETKDAVKAIRPLKRAV